MLDLFIVLQFYYVNKMDYVTEKAYKAAYIQSGLNIKVDERNDLYKNKFSEYKKIYIDEKIEKKLQTAIIISDLLINKKIGITYEF